MPVRDFEVSFARRGSLWDERERGRKRKRSFVRSFPAVRNCEVAVVVGGQSRFCGRGHVKRPVIRGPRVCLRGADWDGARCIVSQSCPETSLVQTVEKARKLPNGTNGRKKAGKEAKGEQKGGGGELDTCELSEEEEKERGRNARNSRDAKRGRSTEQHVSSISRPC